MPQAERLRLTGEGALLQQLTKRVLESALESEITDQLGYDKHDPAGKNGGNSRNGTRGKAVLTDVGPVDKAVPRDREGKNRTRSPPPSGAWSSGPGPCRSWLHPETVSELFRRLYREVDLPPINLRDLRHGTATLTHAGGGD